MNIALVVVIDADRMDFMERKKTAWNLPRNFWLPDNLEDSRKKKWLFLFPNEILRPGLNF